MSESLIYLIIPKIIEELKDLPKAGTFEGGQYTYAYRRAEDVKTALKPLLAKHGISIIPSIKNSERNQWTNQKGTITFSTTVTVEFRIGAHDGTFVMASAIGEAFDTGDKSASKAQTIAYKTMACDVFCITEGNETEHDDKKEEPKGTKTSSDSASRTSPNPSKLDSAVKRAEERGKSEGDKSRYYCPKCGQDKFVYELKNKPGFYFCWLNADKNKKGCGAKDIPLEEILEYKKKVEDLTASEAKPILSVKDMTPEQLEALEQEIANDVPTVKNDLDSIFGADERIPF